MRTGPYAAMTTVAIPQQRGMTLVELMVALTIGSLVLLFLIEIFAQASQNARLQRNIAWLQEDGRVAMEVITRELRLAGYPPKLKKSDPGACKVDKTSNIPAVPNDASCHSVVSATATDCAIFGVDAKKTESTDKISTDSVAVSYLADGYIPDCNGETTPDIRVVSCIEMDTRPTTSTNPNSPALRIGCSNQNTNPPDNKPPKLLMQPVLSNVERLEIVYGVGDTEPPMEPTKILYQTATQINAMGLDSKGVDAWSRVVSVRVSVLIYSRDDNVTAIPQPYQFDDNGDGYIDMSDEKENVPAAKVPDHRLRRAFTSTVMLRNRLSRKE